MIDQAENLRRLSRSRFNADRGARRQRARVIAVASGKGGVGKTNIVVNVGLALSRWGKKVIIVDADLGLANVDILFDLKPRFSLRDVVAGEKKIEEVIIHGATNLRIIPGGSGLLDLANLDFERRNYLIRCLEALEGDIVLFDCGAGLTRNVLGFIAAAEELILVMTPEPTSITDAYALVKVIAELNLRQSSSFLVNMVRSPAEGKEVASRMQTACQKFLRVELRYLGSIASDSAVAKSVQECSPLMLRFPDSRAAADMRLLAQRLLGLEETCKPRSGLSGFLQRLSRFMPEAR